MKRSISVGLLSGLLTFQVYAQDTLRISLEEVQAKVFSNNLDLKISEQVFLSARSDYRQSNSLFLPNVSATHTALSTTNPLMAFGSKLNQERISVADFNPELLNDPDRIGNYATRIEVLQPIFNLDGVKGRQAAALKMEAMGLQAERTKEQFELEVKKAYMQLQLSYQANEVLTSAKQTAEANLLMIENYLEEGLVQDVDLLTVQVRVNEVNNMLQYGNSNVKNASDYLMLLMNGSSSGVVLAPSEKLSESLAEHGDLEANISQRKDIIAIQNATLARYKMVQSETLSLIPRVNAFGAYELYDTKFLKMGASGYIIGLQFSWEIFNGYKTLGRIQKAKAEYQKASLEEQNYKSQSEFEIEKTNRQLLDAENQLKLARLASQQTKEAFRIRSNRFKEGLERTTDLMNAESQMFQKELELSQAIFEYEFTKEYLKFLTK